MLSTLYSSPAAFAINAIALILAVTIHEFSHACMADYLGDPTPRLQKRLTLNPLAHLDPYGTLFMLLVGFGWGKPVVFDPFNLKNPRRDAAFISVAGPASNLILATILSLVLRILPASAFFLFPMVVLNVALAIFNLLPISPLDGFKIVGGLLSKGQTKEWYSLERYGLILLIILLIPIGGSTILHFILQPIISLVLSILLPGPLLGG